MAQIAFKIFLEKSSFMIDFLLCWIGCFIHSFLQTEKVEYIDFEVRKYDTIFYLTAMLLFSRIIITLTVYRDKQFIENQNKKEDLRKKSLENDKLEIDNAFRRSQLPHL